MLTTIEGVYRNGQIELSEQPGNVREARVFVTFTETTTVSNGNKPRPIMCFGMFSGDGATSEEDFELAEWRGENPAR